MNVLKEVIEAQGGAERFRQVGSLRIEKDEITLLLECIGFGPTVQHAVRLVKINQFGKVESEIHLEFRDGTWMPYYLRNHSTEAEHFLYHFVGVREPLRLDFGAGLQLIQATAILDFNLLADGCVRR